MTSLRYQICDDDLVFVTLNGQGAHLDPAEVKRFAWAVLNDLAPDDAFEAGYQPAPIILSTREDMRPRRPGPWQIVAILDLLAATDNIATDIIARHVGTPRTQASAQLSRLKARGYVRLTSRPKAYRPGTWTITDDGRAQLSKLRAFEARHA